MTEENTSPTLCVIKTRVQTRWIDRSVYYTDAQVW